MIIKKKATTSKEFGCEPDKRLVKVLINYGIVNIDKPPGPTSHMVSDFVKRILHIKKAGHGGSLDPRVTGVLPVALGRATRAGQVLLKGAKEYVGIMHLHQEVGEKELKEVIKKFFIGKIKQVPPLKSAVKRREREREIYSFDILEVEGKDVLFKVSCQAGTYIRKLVHDLGKKLGVGAHMADLRRTRVGPFDESSLVTLHDLKDAFVFWKEEGREKFIRHCIQPVEKAVEHLPKVWVLDGAVESLCHGRDLAIPGISKLDGLEKNDMVAILTLKGELIALGVALMNSKEMRKKEKGMAVRTEKVFMEPGSY